MVPKSTPIGPKTYPKNHRRKDADLQPRGERADPQALSPPPRNYSPSYAYAYSIQLQHASASYSALSVIRRPRRAAEGLEVCRTFTRTSADSKASRPIRRPHPQIPISEPCADPQTSNCRFLADCLPTEDSSKIRLVKNSQNRINRTCERQMDCGAILGIVFH